jgi:hypothetical protein
LDSSKNSKLSGPWTKWFFRATAADAVLVRGYRGGVIPMHRALARFRLSRMNVVTAAALLVLSLMIWAGVLPRVCQLWNSLFSFWLGVLPLQADLIVKQYRITSVYSLNVPFFSMEPVEPTTQIWWLTCAAMILIFIATFFLSQKLIPIVYLVRGILIVQGTALLYFAVWPAHFPHTPESYMAALVTAGMGLISTVPVLFGLTYYIFDFGLLRKVLLTAMTMAHLTLFLPFQVLLQALVLQKTVMFMPVLYIIFGMPIDILIIIAFYSWGMTWSFRSDRLQRR